MVVETDKKYEDLVKCTWAHESSHFAVVADGSNLVVESRTKLDEKYCLENNVPSTQNATWI